MTSFMLSESRLWRRDRIRCEYGVITVEMPFLINQEVVPGCVYGACHRAGSVGLDAKEADRDIQTVVEDIESEDAVVDSSAAQK